MTELTPNFRMIAVLVGDRLKYDSTINEINRVGQALFRFRRESFPNEAITSARAQLIQDWILSLASQRMEPTERERLLSDFCTRIAPASHRELIVQILSENGIGIVDRENYERFSLRCFHPQVVAHGQRLFLQGNYFHAVFEACKAYNVDVKGKARSEKDGQPLMLDVWSPAKGTLKVTPCKSETDRNIQDGIKFLSAGLMQAIRNPTSHEPALTWPIGREDCLDVLSFVSFLFRQLDKAVYFNESQ